MAIKRMISRDLEEFRTFQTRMAEVGRVRIGQYETPEGKRGRPVKLDRFRLTSPFGDHIHAAAEEYGGTPREYTPQGSKTTQWEVITEQDALYVYVINGQLIDPVYEFWAAGRTCVRRCDGEWNTVMQEPCVCNGPDRPADPKQLCKVTTRVHVMLPNVAGLNAWRLETHSENAAVEMAAPSVAGLVRAAPMPVPAMLRLRREQRRERNHEKHTFETKDFYVPWFDISAVSAAQIAAGGDAITRALTIAGAPAAIGGTPQQYAIEARPVSAPVAPAQEPMVPPAPVDIERLRPRILADIEAQTTVEGLDAIRTKLKGRGIHDDRVIEAWKSKRAAVVVADELPTGRPYRVLVTGSRTWTDYDTIFEQLDIANTAHRGRMVLVHGDCPHGADNIAKRWAKSNGVPVERHPALHGKKAGIIRNEDMVATRPDVVLSFNRCNSPGTAHCTRIAKAVGIKVLEFVDDTFDPARPDANCVTLPDGSCTSEGPCMHTPDYRVGDTVTVGGIEFTKIGDNPFPSGIIDTAREMFADVPEEYNEAIRRGASPQDIIDAGGPLHWLATDDQLAAINDQFADDLDAVMGTVETTGPVLPDVPDGDYDTDEIYTLLMTGAGQQTPPLTTAEVNALICRTAGVGIAGHATGRDLARLRAGLKSGAVAWR